MGAIVPHGVRPTVRESGDAMTSLNYRNAGGGRSADWAVSRRGGRTSRRRAARRGSRCRRSRPPARSSRIVSGPHQGAGRGGRLARHAVGQAHRQAEAVEDALELAGVRVERLGRQLVGDHDRSPWRAQLPHRAQRGDRVGHVVDALERGDEVVRARDAGVRQVLDVEARAIGDALALGVQARGGDAAGRRCRSRPPARAGTPAPSRWTTTPRRSRRRRRGREWWRRRVAHGRR